MSDPRWEYDVAGGVKWAGGKFFLVPATTIPDQYPLAPTEALVDLRALISDQAMLQRVTDKVFAASADPHMDSGDWLAVLVELYDLLSAREAR